MYLGDDLRNARTMSMLPEKVRYQDVEMEEGVVHATVVQPTQPIV